MCLRETRELTSGLATEERVKWLEGAEEGGGGGHRNWRHVFKHQVRLAENTQRHSVVLHVQMSGPRLFIATLIKPCTVPLMLSLFLLLSSWIPPWASFFTHGATYFSPLTHPSPAPLIPHLEFPSLLSSFTDQSVIHLGVEKEILQILYHLDPLLSFMAVSR